MEKGKNRLLAPVVNLYWRKLLFFAGIFVVGIYALVSTQSFKADTLTNTSLPASSTISIAVNIDENGTVRVDGKKIKDRVKTVGNHDELRFAVLDNPGKIYTEADITLTLPAAVANTTSHEILAIHGVDSSNSFVLDERTIQYKAFGLAPSATVSIVAGMPAGTISEPLYFQAISFLSGIKENIWLILAIILPLLTLSYMFFIVFYESKRQKIDIPAESTDAPPMALPPAVVGVLYHQRVGSREIAATLIDLAQRGDIYVLDQERDFAFAKNHFDRRLLSYEKLLLSKIFRSETRVSGKSEIEERINRHLYSKKISLVTAGIYVLSTRLGYFRVNPQKQHLKFMTIGFLSFFAGVAGFALSLFMFTNPPYIAFFWVGMMAASLIITVMANKIPIRTVLGQEALSDWLAFRKFLTSKERIPYSFGNPDLFERYLPYAIVLDCEVAWAKRFSEDSFTLPKWFVTERSGMGLEDFCLSLFPIVSYVGRSLAAIREPGFE